MAQNRRFSEPLSHTISRKPSTNPFLRALADEIRKAEKDHVRYLESSLLWGDPTVTRSPVPARWVLFPAIAWVEQLPARARARWWAAKQRARDVIEVARHGIPEEEW